MRNASWGTSTRPTCFIRFLSSFYLAREELSLARDVFAIAARGHVLAEGCRHRAVSWVATTPAARRLYTERVRYRDLFHPVSASHRRGESSLGANLLSEPLTRGLARHAEGDPDFAP